MIHLIVMFIIFLSTWSGQRFALFETFIIHLCMNLFFFGVAFILLFNFLLTSAILNFKCYYYFFFFLHSLRLGLIKWAIVDSMIIINSILCFASKYFTFKIANIIIFIIERWWSFNFHLCLITKIMRDLLTIVQA